MRDKQTELPYPAAIAAPTTATVSRGTREARTYRLVSHRWELVRDASFPSLTEFARVPGDAAKILIDRIGSEPQENFVVMPLTTRTQILAVDVITIGTVNGCMVSAADVFRRVLAHADAVACIVGHNHPSGDVSPSAEDRALTMRLIKAGRVLGLQVLDHIVVSAVAGGDAPQFWSFLDHGEMEAKR